MSPIGCVCVSVASDDIYAVCVRAVCECRSRFSLQPKICSIFIELNNLNDAEGTRQHQQIEEDTDELEVAEWYAAMPK